MKRSPTIAVIIVPGRRLESWLEALQIAAEQAGLVYQEDWGAEEVALKAEGCLTVVWTEKPCVADQILVVAPDPADAVRGCSLLYNLTGDEALRHASRRFSFAAFEVGRGARLVRPGPDVVDLPIIGPVLLPASEPVRQEARLAMFNHLPPAVADAGVWPPSLMWRAGPERLSLDEVPIDLTGRGRVLAFGPYVMLPPGQWRLTVLFDVEIGNAPVTVAFHWGIDGSAVCEEVEIAMSGRYKLHIDHTWIEAGATQLHLSLPRAAFSGYLKLHRMHCELIAARNAARNSNPVLDRRSSAQAKG